MWLEMIKNKPRSQAAAQGLAVIGFLSLTVMAYTQDNYVVAALFTLPAFYYCRKLVKIPAVNRRVSEPPTASIDVQSVKSELREMQTYYRRLKKGWLWTGVFGWSCTVLMVFFAPSIFLLVIVGLAGYASYAYMRCHNAIRFIEAGLGGRR